MYRTLQRRFCPLDEAVFVVRSAFHQLKYSIGLVCAMYNHVKVCGNSRAIASRISVHLTANTAVSVSSFKRQSIIKIFFLCVFVSSLIFLGAITLISKLFTGLSPRRRGFDTHGLVLVRSQATRYGTCGKTRVALREVFFDYISLPTSVSLKFPFTRHRR